MKKVSVIIPYVKGRGYLREAIKSVKAQSYPNVELVMAKSSNPVGTNLNTGISNSTGDYICYLCDDDLLPVDSIRDRVKAMQDYDFIHGCAEEFGIVNRPYIPILQRPMLEDMLHKNVINGGTVMYRREVFEQHGIFDEKLTCGEEYEYNLRLLFEGAEIGYCDNVVYLYRRHNKQKGRPTCPAEKKKRLEQVEQIKNRFR